MDGSSRIFGLGYQFVAQVLLSIARAFTIVWDLKNGYLTKRAQGFG